MAVIGWETWSELEKYWLQEKAVLWVLQGLLNSIGSLLRVERQNHPLQIAAGLGEDEDLQPAERQLQIQHLST